MGQVFRICYTLQFWLSWDAATVAVLHCNTGVLRTGFIVACFLVYTGQLKSIEEALEFFSSRRLVSMRPCGCSSCFPPRTRHCPRDATCNSAGARRYTVIPTQHPCFRQPDAHTT